MSEDKTPIIDLEAILNDHVEMLMREHPDDYISIEDMKQDPAYATIMNAMLDACKQTLELAVKNAKLITLIDGKAIKLKEGQVAIVDKFGEYTANIDLDSILHTITQVKTKS